MGKTNTVEALEKAYKVFESRGIENQESTVEDLKLDASQLWATLDGIKAKPGSEAARLIAIAKTNIETAVMFGVKACSRLKEQVSV